MGALQRGAGPWAGAGWGALLPGGGRGRLWRSAGALMAEAEVGHGVRVGLGEGLGPPSLQGQAAATDLDHGAGC